MNALTVYSPDELELLKELDLMPAGMENLRPGDTGMPPRLRISSQNQPLEIGGKEIQSGHIANLMTGENWKTVNVIPLVFLPVTRVMWPATYSADNAAECASNDGRFPREDANLRSAQPGPCANCPMSQFTNGAAPRCSEQRNFLVYVVETGEAAILTLQRTGTKSARHLTALARSTGIKRAISMTTTKVSGDKGTWWEPVFSRGEPLPVNDILAIAELRNELKNLTITADIVDEAPPAAAEPVFDEVPF